MRVSAPAFPLLEQLLHAVAGLAAAGEQWLPWWTGWPRAARAPFPLPALPGPPGGEVELLFLVCDGEPEAGNHAGDAGEEAPDVLVAWRPSPELSWTTAAPVLLIGGEGDVDLVAGSVEDLVRLLLAAGNLALELPRNAAELRRLSEAVQGPGRDALERLRVETGLEPIDLEALGARLAATRAVHGPDLAPPAPAPPLRTPETWAVTGAAPDFARAFRPGASLAVAVMLLHEGRAVRLEGRPATAELVHVGSLRAPQGKLVVGDVITRDQLPPQPLEVPPGDHPAFVAVARFPGGGTRVAALLLSLADAAPARWERSWAFQVESGLAAITSATALEVWREDPERHADRLQRAIRRAGTSWTGLRLHGSASPGEPLGLVACSSGWGDGEYVTWLGRDADGRVVAVLAGFGLLPGDTPEGAAEPPPPPTTLPALERLRELFEGAYHRVLNGGDARELGPHLAPQVRLEGPIQARGADAVLAGLARRPLGDDPITFNGQGDLDEAAGSLRLRFAPAARPTAERGWLRLVARGELLHRIAITLDPTPPPPPLPGATPTAHEQASPVDHELVEALGALNPTSPVRRAQIEDLRRHVLALGRPLSDEQRRKARELLGEE